MSECAREVFRPYVHLRVAVVCAVAFWASLLALVIIFNGVPARTYVGLVLLSVLFSLSAFYYCKLQIAVDDEGVTCRSILSLVSFRWEDIRHIVISGKGFFTAYHILAFHKSFTFTTMLRGHRQLCRLIIQRASLERPIILE